MERILSTGILTDENFESLVDQFTELGGKEIITPDAPAERDPDFPMNLWALIWEGEDESAGVIRLYFGNEATLARYLAAVDSN